MEYEKALGWNGRSSLVMVWGEAHHGKMGNDDDEVWLKVDFTHLSRSGKKKK
jgi:hypothetical protein